MHIFLKIIGDTTEPQKLEYHGNYAIEFMLFAVIETYYGKKLKLSFESLLKRKLEETEELYNES